MRKIIGIAGRATAGKSTLAREIAARVPQATILSFASEVKAEVQQAGFPWHEIEAKKPWMRSLLQAYGQAKRELWPDYWVNKLIEKLPKAGIVIIDDLRYPNEVETLQALGATLVHITRRNNASPEEHESERALKAVSYEAWDYAVFFETGDLKSLRGFAEKLAQTLNPQSKIDSVVGEIGDRVGKGEDIEAVLSDILNRHDQGKL